MRIAFVAASALVAFAVSGIAHANVTFSDQNFATTTWVTDTIIVGTGGSASASQESTGNPGFARRVTVTTGNTVGDVTYAFHRYGNTTATRYEPSVSGAIQAINWTIDARFVTGSFIGAGQAIMLGLRQNNINYYADYDVTGSSGQWNTFGATGLVASNFQRVDGLAGSPDFSASASNIRFGFITANSNGGGAYFTTVDYDNWAVDVIVPTPGSLALAGLGGLMMARRRR